VLATHAVQLAAVLLHFEQLVLHAVHADETKAYPSKQDNGIDPAAVPLTT